MDLTVALELPRLIERMHRRYLDALSAALGNMGAEDISPQQLLMLVHIASSGVDTEISVRELIERGYYQGSNTSYNLKQLVDRGYVDRQLALRDKRSARLKLTDKAQAVLTLLRARDTQIAGPLLEEQGGPEACETTYKFLRQLESRWAAAVRAEHADVLHFIE
jgi:DNA-binding MarR family transcriptional regulator